MTSVGPSISSHFKVPQSPFQQREFDPATMHPASIIPVSEMSDLTDKYINKQLNGIHPASIPSPRILVRDGYGELVLRVKEGGRLRPVTKDEYAKAYLVFQKYAPRLHDVPTTFAASRIEMMRRDLRKINPNMVATFIPRTLHDLIFIRKSMEEDIEREKAFLSDDPRKLTKEEFDAFKIRLSKNSWFADLKRSLLGSICPKIAITTPSDVGKHLSTLIDIGYRLNLAAIAEIDRYGANIEDLSHHQIEQLVDLQIQFLEGFAKDPALAEHFKKSTIDMEPSSGFIAPFSGFFAYFTINNRVKKLGLRKMAFIECQESMAGKILCYRGGRLGTDSPIKISTDKREFPYSISFGSAAFPGIVNDIGACAFYHMFYLFHEGKEDAYILVLDPSQESTQTFHAPSYTALESLFGDGETWHYRFKSSKEEHRKILGITLTGEGFSLGMSDSDKFDVFKGPLTVKQTVDKFEDLKKHNLILVYHLDMAL